MSSMTGTGKKYYHYLSVLRIAACFGVVLLHTCLAAQGALNLTTSEHIATSSIKNLLLWAAPCFIMVSGALLLDPDRGISLKKLYGSYVRRILVVLVVFTLLFHVVDLVLDGTAVTPGVLFGGFARKLLTGGSWAHMWYLYMLLSLYLLLPAYRLISGHADAKTLRYLALVAFGFLSVVPMVELITGAKSAFFINEQYIYPVYFFAGFLIHREILVMKKGGAAAMFLASSALLILLTYIGISREVSVLTSLLGRYSFPLVVLQTVSLFALLRGGMGEKPLADLAAAFVGGLDRCTFGIYLLHLLPVKLLFVVLEWDPYVLGGWPGLLVTAAGVFAVTWLAVWLLRMVPGVRRWI